MMDITPPQRWKQVLINIYPNPKLPPSYLMSMIHCTMWGLWVSSDILLSCGLLFSYPCKYISCGKYHSLHRCRWHNAKYYSQGFTAHRNTEGATSFMVDKLYFPSKVEAQIVRDEYFKRYHSTAKVRGVIIIMLCHLLYPDIKFQAWYAFINLHIF